MQNGSPKNSRAENEIRNEGVMDERTTDMPSYNIY